MKLNILKHSREDFMIFPTKALFGNLFILNTIFVFEEALWSECKRFIKNLGSLERALVLSLKICTQAKFLILWVGIFSVRGFKISAKNEGWLAISEHRPIRDLATYQPLTLKRGRAELVTKRRPIQTKWKAPNSLKMGLLFWKDTLFISRGRWNE